MTSNVEQRLLRLEGDKQALQQQVATILGQIAALGQQQFGAGGGFGGGGGGGGGTYFGCSLTSALNHGSSVGSQTVWKLVGGSRTAISNVATIYNDGPTSSNDIASGTQVIVAANDDGSYTATGVYC
jgi:hypothetical protein